MLIGHKDIFKQLDIMLNSAKNRNTSIPHILLAGHPGCGKTTLAKYIAKKTKCDFISVIPETLNNEKSIKNLLENLNTTNYNSTGDRIGTIKPSVIFIDEIHQLPLYGQEKLGIIMEDFLMDTGQPNKYYWVPYFTLIGATTLSGKLSKPFLNRFKRTFFINPYALPDSINIIKMHAKRLKINITTKAARDIGIRGRGIPRIMIGFLESCRDTAFSINSKVITSAVTKMTFKYLKINKHGYNESEIKLLVALYKAESTMGLEALSIIIGESPQTIKNELETYLLQNQLINRTGSGRMITKKGIDYVEQFITKKDINNTKEYIPKDYIRK